FGSSSGARDVAQGYADARKQLIDPERLGHVIVGAEIERVHLVGLAAARGEDDDRRPRPLANAADHLETVTVRKVEIEHDEVGLAALVARERVTRGPRGLHLESVAAQVRP